MFIPETLSSRRSGFLEAMLDKQAAQKLQESWKRFGAGVLPPNALMAPTGLSVSGFQHHGHLCLLILFPTPKAPGESHFGFIVAGPSDDWSPEATAKVPVRYFLLERSTSPLPTLFEWRPSNTDDEEIFDNHGAGIPPHDPTDFTELILSRFYGLKPGV